MTLNQTMTRDVTTIDETEWDFHEALVNVLPSLRQQAYALTRNRADADDLVQAAVGNALAAKTSFQVGTNFKAWMLRIVRNRFLSDMRRRRETVAIEDAPQELFARSGGQEDNLVMQELRRNLARLPADQRLALMMITVQGMSYEEVSEQLGVAVGTLKCRVFRARKQLQAWLMGDEAPTRAKATRVAMTASARGRDARNIKGAEAGVSLQH
ncbi:sigma-70 family RNA polymerase sigma factor [Rhodovarius lipocyclicus]|uniref:sigma-70 family RNA polymerase sigma factor n=1 Tax=Rhodovarius lipocyclicus TaxID=268410 RepID=UPI001F21DDC6|nr:sigma-70 family RNA polymerase sigma factor [Rhodovarius lipocyclicus]